MNWINYHHLLYFWTVAKEGSIVRATVELRLSQPTISGQIRALEDSLGKKLFQRAGRNLVLTDIGRVEGVKERFYAISIEQKLKHPAVVAISEAAREKFVG